MKILTPIKSIRQKCLDCSCWQPQEVRLCEHTECALYPYRMGRRPRKSPPSTLEAVKPQKRQLARGFKAIVGILLGLMIASPAFADYTDTQIVNAIYKAEGGENAQYLYGIRSLKYENRSNKSLSRNEWAKMICFNTVRNNRKRYADYGHNQYSTYLEFLASRYCPVGCDNDRGTNQYWLKNVRWFLNNE